MATPRKAHLNRNIGIAAFLTTVLIVSVGATIYFTHPKRPAIPEFSLSLSSSNGTVMQGSSIQTSVSIFNFSDGAEKVSLSGNTGSSGIECNFDPSTDANSFTSNLTIDAPSSTPTNNYLLNVTATNGEVTHEASYNISVLSAKVSVTGELTWAHPTSDFSVNPIRIQFSDTSTGASYLATVSEADTSTYSLSLDNEHTYNVTFYYNVVLWAISPIEPAYSAEASLGFVTVYAPAGNITEILNFYASFL
jgi:hypothetical protein